MAYKVKQNGATLKKLATQKKSNRDPEQLVPLYDERVYFEGDIIDDDDLAEIHVRQYDANEGNIRELIERVEKKTARKPRKSTQKQD